MHKLKWLETSYHMRKFCTLTELVLEAKELVEKPYRSKRHKKHPDLPTKLLTAFLCFFKEKWSLYSQKYLKLSNQQLTNLLSEEYKELPEQIRLKYFHDFQKEKQEFEEKLAQFKTEHSDLFQNFKKSDVTKRTPKRGQKKFQNHGQEAKSPPETHFFKRMKFHKELKKTPVNRYEKFHQDLWSSWELQDVPLRECMVQTGRGWQ